MCGDHFCSGGSFQIYRAHGSATKLHRNSCDLLHDRDVIPMADLNMEDVIKVVFYISHSMHILDPRHGFMVECMSLACTTLENIGK